jgi:hypothetical protein
LATPIVTQIVRFLAISRAVRLLDGLLEGEPEGLRVRFRGEFTDPSFRVRLAVGLAGITAGLLTYPTGRIVSADRAVPSALILVGAIFTAQSLLEVAWTQLKFSDMRPLLENIEKLNEAQALSFTSSTHNLAVGTFISAVTTVLGILAAFGTSPAYAIRLGTILLVIGAILGLMLLNFGIAGPRTANLAGWLVSILFGASALGLACIGFAVYFR